MGELHTPPMYQIYSSRVYEKVHSLPHSPEEKKRALKNAYRGLFKSAAPLVDVLSELEQIDDENVEHLVRFIRGSKRGFIRA